MRASRRDFFWAPFLLSGGISSCFSGSRVNGTATHIPENFFGLHVNHASPRNLSGRPQTPFPNIGQRAIRLWDAGTAWRDLNPFRNSFYFERLDYRINEAILNNCEVILTLGGTPDWATVPSQNARSSNPSPPRDINDWNFYVDTVTKHCGNSIAGYEIWNEPDLLSGFSGSLEQLISLAKAAFEIIRKNCPKSRIFTPAFSAPYEKNDRSPLGLRSYASAGGLVYCDAVAIHAYPGDGNEPERLIEKVHAARAILDEHGGAQLPLYDTESGGRGWRDRLGVLHNVPVSNFNEPLPLYPVDMQSAWVTRHLLCAASSGVKQSYYYDFDNPSGEAGLTSVMAIHMTDYPKNPSVLFSSALAYKFVAQLIGGGNISNIEYNNGLYSVSFETKYGITGKFIWTKDFDLKTYDLKGAKIMDNVGKTIKNSEFIFIGPSPIVIMDR